MVDDVIDVLKLHPVRHAIVGNESLSSRSSRISGGQRKRVNVGIEMVADPSALFLDEPTSGLDSATSFDLMQALLALSATGSAIVAVLHQPSFPIFTLFHELLLLGPGGRTVYQGQPREVQGYFEGIGFRMEPMSNPADFILDCISHNAVPAASASEDSQENAARGRTEEERDSGAGQVHPNHDQGNQSFGVRSGQYTRLPLSMEPVQGAPESPSLELVQERVDLGRLWLSKRRSRFSERLQSQSGPGESDLDAASDSGDGVYIPNAVLALSRPRGFCGALLVFTGRALRQQFHALTLLIFDLSLALSTGFILGYLYSDTTLASLAPTVLMYSLGLGLTISLASLKTFGQEREVFWREGAKGSGMGLSQSAYFVAKNIADVPRLCLLTTMIAVAFFPQANLLNSLPEFLLESLVAAWAISGWAYLFSILLDPKAAQLAMVVALLGFMLTAGVTPSLSTMLKHSSGFISLQYALSNISYARWLCEDLFVAHTVHLTAAFRFFPALYENPRYHSLVAVLTRQRFSEAFQIYHLLPMNSFMNLWIGTLARVLAFSALVLANRNQMGKPGWRALLFSTLINPLQDRWTLFELKREQQRRRG